MNGRDQSCHSSRRLDVTAPRFLPRLHIAGAVTALPEGTTGRPPNGSDLKHSDPHLTRSHPRQPLVMISLRRRGGAENKATAAGGDKIVRYNRPPTSNQSLRVFPASGCRHCCGPDELPSFTMPAARLALSTSSSQTKTYSSGSADGTSTPRRTSDCRNSSSRFTKKGEPRRVVVDSLSTRTRFRPPAPRGHAPVGAQTRRWAWLSRPHRVRPHRGTGDHSGARAFPSPLVGGWPGRGRVGGHALSLGPLPTLLPLPPTRGKEAPWLARRL